MTKIYKSESCCGQGEEIKGKTKLAKTNTNTKTKTKIVREKPGGVAAYDGIGVVLVHRCSTGDAEDEENDHHVDNYLHKDDDNEHNSGINLKTLQPQRSTI